MAENFWLEVIKGMDRGSQEYKSMYQAASKKHRERLEKEVGPPIVEKNKGSGVETVDTGVTKTAGEPPPPPGGSGRRGGMELVRPDNLPPPARGGAVNRDDESRLETRGGMPSGGYSQRLMGPQEQMTQGDVSGGQSRVRPRAGSTDQSGSGGALNVRPQGPGAMGGLRGFSSQTNPVSRTGAGGPPPSATAASAATTGDSSGAASGPPAAGAAGKPPTPAPSVGGAAGSGVLQRNNDPISALNERMAKLEAMLSGAPMRGGMPFSQMGGTPKPPQEYTPRLRALQR